MNICKTKPLLEVVTIAKNTTVADTTVVFYSCKLHLLSVQMLTTTYRPNNLLSDNTYLITTMIRQSSYII